MERKDPVNGGCSPGDPRDRTSPASQLGIPTPDDLTGWKEADRRLIERFAQYLESDPRPVRAALEKRAVAIAQSRLRS